ncbi:hypothetical protein VTP01DRAFT_4234 [Rhizomucor pusillus]|uniref:uncharacterized protein n=1 Tax=Rhizomucor pusillus TaxID=4840 RepID=UPI00374253D9
MYDQKHPQQLLLDHKSHKMQPASTKYSYRPCPICSERLLVRIHGSFVYKWILDHFAAQHNEWLHVVVNLRESWN